MAMARRAVIHAGRPVHQTSARADVCRGPCSPVHAALGCVLPHLDAVGGAGAHLGDRLSAAGDGEAHGPAGGDTRLSSHSKCLRASISAAGATAGQRPSAGARLHAPVGDGRQMGSQPGRGLCQTAGTGPRRPLSPERGVSMADRRQQDRGEHGGAMHHVNGWTARNVGRAGDVCALWRVNALYPFGCSV